VLTASRSAPGYLAPTGGDRLAVGTGLSCW